ncbi:MAG: transcriptional regulator NrdR [Cardiobacteriaceae bacterium]|nr:transcriptional regulator NrdR [Cardiobacteriaceae bacterium]
MHCPVCNSADTKVVDSRFVAETNRIRRRRECQNPGCGERFTTFESIETFMPMIVKQNGNRESYSTEKLRRGLTRAIEKRPVTAEQLNQLIAHIEQRLRQSGEREIASKLVGQWVLEGLKNLDHVAYIRFASVYLSFEDVAAFEQTIAELGGGQGGM